MIFSNYIKDKSFVDFLYDVDKKKWINLIDYIIDKHFYDLVYQRSCVVIKYIISLIKNHRIDNLEKILMKPNSYRVTEIAIIAIKKATPVSDNIVVRFIKNIAPLLDKQQKFNVFRICIIRGSKFILEYCSNESLLEIDETWYTSVLKFMCRYKYKNNNKYLFRKPYNCTNEIIVRFLDTYWTRISSDILQLAYDYEIDTFNKSSRCILLIWLLINIPGLKLGNRFFEIFSHCIEKASIVQRQMLFERYKDIIGPRFISNMIIPMWNDYSKWDFIKYLVHQIEHSEDSIDILDLTIDNISSFYFSDNKISSINILEEQLQFVMGVCLKDITQDHLRKIFALPNDTAYRLFDYNSIFYLIEHFSSQ